MKKVGSQPGLFASYSWGARDVGETGVYRTRFEGMARATKIAGQQACRRTGVLGGDWCSEKAVYKWGGGVHKGQYRCQKKKASSKGAKSHPQGKVVPIK